MDFNKFFKIKRVKDGLVVKARFELLKNQKKIEWLKNNHKQKKVKND